ncbi:hypothetical protein GIB67_008687 [Kingdonia uniflora]|uniref:Uncharacterized protein n=1 Tax=Kingdonia uniflora TaxID=39325 RepID=A0A7J7M525_9MAGN|nr:hypothetical protein GIB67_008687 [Kingdonia uniflora]
MVRESGRRCSHCGHNGHNCRTCNEKLGMKLFGVRISRDLGDDSMKKSKSMGSLQSCRADRGTDERGYLSDGLVDSDHDAHDRKKGVPWTEDEHRTFLAGLENLGKGDWRGISRRYVTTRTPTQVASHAQKYFLRQATPTRQKRRPSLFDVAIKNSVRQSANFPRQLAPGAYEPLPLYRPIARLTKSIPNFYGHPYMGGMVGGRPNYTAPRLFSPVSFPMVNFPSNGYMALPNSQNKFPNPPQPSQMSQTPETVPDGASTTERGSGSGVNTDLGLGISRPRTPGGIKLSEPSNPGGAISVI